MRGDSNGRAEGNEDECTHGERESISLFIGISRIKKIIDVSKYRYFLLPA